MNIRILMVGMIASGVLFGCASTDKVLSKEPTEVFHSDKDAREVAFCIADKNNTSAFERADGSRNVLVKNGYGGVALAFTIFAEGTGSKIEYRRQFGIIGPKWKQCIGVKDD